MAYLRIHCGYCGGTWDVYHSQKDIDPARTCPHCDQKIDRSTWQGNILPAYNAMRTANLELLNNHVQQHATRFAVDFVADGEFQNATAIHVSDFDNLRSDLEDVKKSVRMIADVLGGGEIEA